MANDDDQRFPSQTADKYVVRFPEGMRDRIAEAAKANNRSMNAEIVARLDGSFKGLFDDLDAWAADKAEDARSKLLLKDSLISDLIRDGVNLRHNLLHLAILIEHASGMTHDPFLLSRFESLADVARERASFQYMGDFGDRSAMSPELLVVLQDALKTMERGLARTRAFFAADNEKLEELLKEVDLPSLEQLEAIRKSDLSDGLGLKVQTPTPPPAEGGTRELADPEAARRALRKETEEYVVARLDQRGLQPGQEDRQPKEPTPQTREEMRREVDEAHAAYIEAQRELDALPPLPGEEPAAEQPKPRHRLDRMTKAKKRVK